MGKFNRIFHHITVEDVKNKWSDSLEESIARQFKEDEEKRIVNELVDEIKSDWKSELSDLWKQDWRDKIEEGMTTQVFQEQPAFKAVPLPSTGMNSSQDFAMFTNIGGMHNDTGVRFTLSGLGGTESLPIFNYPLEAGGSVKAIDVFAMGQNNSVQIDLSNFGLQGRTIPLGSKLSRRLNKKKEEDMNKQLNSSENFTKKINADEYMKARVTNVRIDKAALEKQKADEKFLNKQQTIVNLTKGFGMIGLPNDFAQWTLNYARGNLTPITKFSRSMTNQVRDLVLDKFAASPSGTKTVNIQYGDYGGNPFSKISTKLGLGRFTATKLPNGDIKITDTFNVDKTATHIGSARIIPGLQDTANRLVNIAHERRGITGNYDEGGIPINVIIKNSGRFAANAEHNKNRRSMQRGKYYSGFR